MCKNGDHYWVKAVVSPTYSAGQKVAGYSSIRRKPSQQALSVIEPLYAEMIALEAKAGVKDAIDESMQHMMTHLNGRDYEEYILSI